MIRIHCIGKTPITIKPKLGKKGNFVYKINSPFGPSFFNKTARDMIRIGQAVFLADRAFRRGQRLGQQTRQLAVEVPVEEPERWNSLAEDVAQLASFVSKDYWQFKFLKLKEKNPKFHRSGLNLDNPSIHLFSDGLDSLCGAAMAFQRGETPLFISHVPPGITRVRQRICALKEALGFPKAPAYFISITFTTSDRDAHGKRNMFPERTRRTRPFLYLSMAGAVALELGISKIFLNENGFLSVNLPFRSDISGAQITRHAHPETLRRYEFLLQRLWPYHSTVTVQNPFFHLTKGEELEVLGNGLHLAKETTSCEYARQQVSYLKGWLKKKKGLYKNWHECGLCYPCLVRQSAMYIANVIESTNHYIFDAKLSFKNREPKTDAPLYNHIADYVKDLHIFCDRIKRMTYNEFTLSYITELSLLSGPGENIYKLAHNIYDLYNRFADQFIQFIDS